MTQQKKVPFLLRKVKEDGERSWFIPSFMVEDILLIGLEMMVKEGVVEAIDKPENFFKDKTVEEVYGEVAEQLGFDFGDESVH